jgi:hypothetical protein
LKQQLTELVRRDITTYTKSNKAVRPSRTFTHHSSIVNDVQHHPLHSSLIGTVSDDITLQILDTRQDDSTRAAASADGQHRDAINSISFNPAAETILATGSADKTIGIWDLRNLKSKLHSLEGHTDSVQSISWHPFEESVLASSSYDRKIMFWDLSRAGEEQTPEDAQDGPPELYVTLCLACINLFELITDFIPGYLCTVDTQTVSLTSAGTLATPGFFALLLRTIYCRCGRWPMPSWARTWMMSPLKSWRRDIYLTCRCPFNYLPYRCFFGADESKGQ